MLSHRKFYILGCQRTGTTLLELILESHRDVFCFGELCGYTAFARPETIDVHDPWIGFDIPGMTEQMFEAEARGLYSGEPLLFTERNVLDVVASMAKLPHPSGSFLAGYIVPVVQRKLIGDLDFCCRFTAEIDFLAQFPWPSLEYMIASGAIYYKWVHEFATRYEQAGFPVLRVPYESLVTSPRAQLDLVCQFLGLDWSDCLLEHHLHPHNEVIAPGIALGNNRTDIPIHTLSVGRGSRILSRDLSSIVISVMALGSDQKSP